MEVKLLCYHLSFSLNCAVQPRFSPSFFLPFHLHLSSPRHHIRSSPSSTSLRHHIMIKDSNCNDALEVVYCHHDIERELTNPTTTTTATATSSKEDANASPSSSKSLGYFSKKNIVLATVCGIGIGGAAAVAGISGAAARSAQIQTRKNAADPNAQGRGGKNNKGKGKADKPKPGDTFLTGQYSGFDTEDGSPQQLYLLCGDETCDVTLQDARFSTCEQVLGAGEFFGGVAVARDVPADSLDDFSLELYCTEESGGSIDFTKNPDSILTGDIDIQPNGQLIRTGPDFFYTPLSFINPEKKVEAEDIDDIGYNINGAYSSADMSDGSNEVRSLSLP